MKNFRIFQKNSEQSPQNAEHKKTSSLCMYSGFLFTIVLIFAAAFLLGMLFDRYMLYFSNDSGSYGIKLMSRTEPPVKREIEDGYDSSSKDNDSSSISSMIIDHAETTAGITYIEVPETQTDISYPAGILVLSIDNEDSSLIKVRDIITQINGLEATSDSFKTILQTTQSAQLTVFRNGVYTNINLK